MSKFILDKRYEDVLHRANISIREALQLAKLPQDLFRKKVAMITVYEYIRLIEAIEALALSEELPILIGTQDQIETFSPPIFAAYCSENTLMCMKRLSTYKKLIGPFLLLVTETEDEILIELKFEDLSYELPSFLIGLEFSFLVHLMRRATKKQIVPKKVTTVNELKSLKYEEFFGVKPTTDVRNLLIISKQDAMIPFISQNDSMWDYFEPELKRRLSELEIDDTISARVRSALIELLPAGQGSIEDVATRLGYSKRTLQRKLKDENTSFQKQLNHTRELLAKHYLIHLEMSSEEISYLLGYQDLNSFTRAFSMWTEMTVLEYKKAHGVSK